MKDYQATIDYLYNQLPMFQRTGNKALRKTLEGITLLCTALGHPQNNYPTVHIGGTNGKGSTAHIVMAILKQAGYKVGLYTSPHYIDFRERIKINGELLPQEDVVDFVSENQEIIQKIQPSFFEITVAMAFHSFQKHKVDIAIIEVGLGGNFDSTNIINPLVSVITNIGYDHKEVLGDSLALIAGEKAGIIKKQTPVIIGEQHEETSPVFLKKAAEMNAPILFSEELMNIKLLHKDAVGAHYHISSKTGEQLYSDLVFELKGDYQRHNLRAALCTIEQLKKISWSISQEDVLLACRNVVALSNIMGRWQQLGEKPLIIADSAHNAEGIQYVIDGFKQINYQTLHLVLGFSREKDLSLIFPLLPKNAHYYFCKPNQPRGLKTEALIEKARAFGIEGLAYSSVQAAFDAAQEAAHKDDLIFVGGSIFVLAELLTQEKKT
ncbi:MAG: bifunctional folylpolyglutamate synthase/dihydrofolate synthase [Saprospiraceae bacterium]|nr:bifunctional folylpolyglutamate synthase/dihydrofolate synthase [Saprospiraceae bacterium]